MKITILGWYGTETLGDRSILEGILKIFEEIAENNCISIGSLYPFFTERTLYEEQDSFKILSLTSSISCFDIKNNHLLKQCILNSDIVIMGGGPLMDILELDYIDKAFQYAKVNKIKTAVIGCGIGPLNGKAFRKSVYNILRNSCLNILRDKNSIKEAKILNNEFGNQINFNNIYSAYDPAIIPIKYFKPEKNIKKSGVVVNFREYPFQVKKEKYEVINNNLIGLLIFLSKRFDEVTLLPNHTFTIGGDDRKFLSKLRLQLSDYKNIKVIQEPCSLFETFNIIANSKVAVGMRYHAILFQTLLNGNNYIVDYTDKKSGKIISFLEMIDNDGFYKDRYSNLVSNESQGLIFDFNNRTFKYDSTIFDNTINFYKNKILELFKNKRMKR